MIDVSSWRRKGIVTVASGIQCYSASLLLAGQTASGQPYGTNLEVYPMPSPYHTYRSHVHLWEAEDGIVASLRRTKIWWRLYFISKKSKKVHALRSEGMPLNVVFSADPSRGRVTR